MIVLLLPFLVFAFIFSTAIMLAGQGLYNHSLCFSATWIYLTLYIFLVERVHVVRAPSVRRRRDWLNWACMVMVIASFLGVAIDAHLRPIIQVQADGRCHMGIPGGVSIPFMAVDIGVDAALTGVFLYLLRPVVKPHGLSAISGVFGMNNAKDPHTSLIGSMLIMLPTIANMVQFHATGGRELALVCLALCVADVSWDAIVIHWLTFGSVEAEKELTRSTQESMRAPTPLSLRPKESQEAMNSQLGEWRVATADDQHETKDTVTMASMS
ncbi:hypothetical protein ST47_g8291 [Ascochyta rabiei]|uniref:Uncharacterized protein n=1 Tax=Didymella rabiei TaxID=5454 RepID=A0A162ZDR3_DIDRA|nr:hypothetical protein ST47_g8291 [Ascochyta rabiei]